MTSPDWLALAEAEKVGVAAGWLDPCPHVGFTEMPCTRAEGHELPHLIPMSPDSADTSQIPSKPAPTAQQPPRT